VHGGFDVVLRISSGPQLRADPGVGVRKIGTDRLMVCASPAYLKAHGRPQTPEDLVTHRCLRYGQQQPHVEWRFERDGKPAYVPVPSFFVSNNAEALREATVAGIGISIGPSFMFQADLDRGALVEVLPGMKAEQLSIFLLTPAPKNAPARVRAFTQFVAERAKRGPAGFPDAPSTGHRGGGGHPAPIAAPTRQGL
jgi:DNA-binding transcriptional LysR family regulator